jgi:hypothetical protein
MQAPMGQRSLLRRLLRVPGATLIADVAVVRPRCGSQDATAGHARAVEGYGEAAIPISKARAPAVATLVLVAALWVAAPARADEAPPPVTTPTSTTPDAPPPDPYHAPPKQSKPKAAAPKRSAPVVRSAPAVRSAPTRSYTPPAVTPSAPVRSVPARKAARPHLRKAAHKPKRHVAHRTVAPKPKPVKVTFNPFAGFVATANFVAVPGDSSDRDRYLWLAGFAFALLAVAGLSLQALSTRFFEAKSLR